MAATNFSVGYQLEFNFDSTEEREMFFYDFAQEEAMHWYAIEDHIPPSQR